METKICSKCKQEKNVCEFYPFKQLKDGYRSSCKKCIAEYNHKYSKTDNFKSSYNKRKDTHAFKESKKVAKVKYLNSEYGRQKEIERHKDYYKNNKEKWQTPYYKEKHNERERKYREANPEKTRQIQAKSRKKRRNENPEYFRKRKREYDRRYREDNPDIGLINSAGTRIRRALKDQGVNKTERTIDLLDCTPYFFQEYIKSLFTDGMTLQNHGTGEGMWHLDHIIPCAYFDLNDLEQRKVCFHYSNYQPLWEYDNLSKNSFYNGQMIRKKK